MFTSFQTPGDSVRSRVSTRMPKAFVCGYVHFGKNPMKKPFIYGLYSILLVTCFSCALTFFADDIHARTRFVPALRPHAPAVGSDGVGKRELAPRVVAAAARVIVDVESQSRRLGELQGATKKGHGGGLGGPLGDGAWDAVRARQYTASDASHALKVLNPTPPPKRRRQIPFHLLVA